MNSNFTKHSFILFVLLGLSIHPLLAQSVLNPADPLITYNPKSKPVQPAYGQIGKWVRTVRMGWNSSDYKAYIYNGTAFRLKFPKTYNPAVNDGKKYPILIFFHGYGEKDSIYDNEYQLYHGADLYQTAINNGTFDGYALFMQSTGYWGIGHYQNIVDLVNYMVANNKVDPFQVMLNGLSAGGQAVWEILNSYPSYFCAAMPMSWSSSLYEQSAFVNSVKFTPLWETQGGKDINPAPYTTYQVRDAMLNAGGNYKLTEYPYAEHNTWDPGWNNMDFWPFFKRAYSSNPWTLGGKTQFFPGDTIKATLGLNTGFSAYQWRKDGIVIPSATSNTLTVTQLGVYDARVQRLGIWSEWSRVPVTLKMAAFTVVPATIQAENYNAMSGIMAETTTDAGAGQDVAYIDNGDWMDYAVSVPTAGKYAIDFRISSPYTDAQIQVRAFDRSILGTLNVPKTGDWQIWKTATDTITLPAGYQTLRLMSTGASGWNINWINIKFLGAVIPVTPPP
ncbi:MAG TPA: carbohydrate-binding protein, partial [Flavisolibacter sp.]|nr:carbohydrate-binding protein [Flavisolibacter sp.]